MPDRVFLDTNIIVYAHDVASPKKRDAAQKLIFDGLRDSTAAISSQVLSEFFARVSEADARPVVLERSGSGD